MSLENYVTDYNPIASVYHSFVNEKLEDEEMFFLEQLIRPNVCEKAHFLDIGCATGRTVKILNILGYQTTGIDVSEELLRIASSNAPDSKFILGDIRELELQPIYDAILSNDMLGHIPNLEELTKVFRKVYMAMRDNGIFAFTGPILKNENWDKVQTMLNDKNARNYTADISDQYVYLERSYLYNQEEKITEVKLTGFKLINGVWQRSDTTVLVKHYLISEIKSALVNAGFIEINEYDSNNFGYKSKLIFTCRKPSVL